MVPLQGVDLEDGYASFRPDGSVTVAAFLSLLEGAMKACREAGSTKLLVDARNLKHSPLTTPDLFELGTGLAAFWDRDIKLAMVGRPEQLDPEKFGRFVAENRGLRYSAHASPEGALLELLGPTPAG